jgi:hypothetical protein
MPKGKRIRNTWPTVEEKKVQRVQIKHHRAEYRLFLFGVKCNLSYLMNFCEYSQIICFFLNSWFPSNIYTLHLFFANFSSPLENLRFVYSSQYFRCFLWFQRTICIFHCFAHFVQPFKNLIGASWIVAMTRLPRQKKLPRLKTAFELIWFMLDCCVTSI